MDPNLGKKPSFVQRNLVALVMIPSLILVHWGWRKLQDVETLVTPAERDRVLSANHLKKALGLKYTKVEGE